MSQDDVYACLDDCECMFCQRDHARFECDVLKAEVEDLKADKTALESIITRLEGGCDRSRNRVLELGDEVDSLREHVKQGDQLLIDTQAEVARLREALLASVSEDPSKP